MKKNSISFFCIMLFLLIVPTGCTFSPPDFSKDPLHAIESQLKPNESLDHFASRMHDEVNKMARQTPDTLYNVTVSFKKYISYKDVEKFASRFEVTSGVQVFYAVHSLKGPPPLSSGKPLAQQFQNLKNNLIADYSVETYKGHPLQELAAQELKEDRLFIGYITFHISPKLAKKIWDKNSDVVRFVQIMNNPSIQFGGFPPEQESQVSGIADADEHIAHCEASPDSSIPWPTLPDTCKH